MEDPSWQEFLIRLRVGGERWFELEDELADAIDEYLEGVDDDLHKWVDDYLQVTVEPAYGS